MSTPRLFKPDQPYLGPDGLRLAAQAYEAALREIGEDLRDIPGHRARRIVARCVIREALRGRRDPGRLRGRAVAILKRVARTAS
jgi:hypothetical protein